MRNTIPFAAIAAVLFIGSILLWVESGRSYNNIVAPLGNFKVVAEMKDFAVDFQLTFPEDPISHGLHGYSKHSWSDASPFGRFEVPRLFGTPDGKIPYYSQIIFPSWLFAMPTLLLLFFALKLTWEHRTKRPEQGEDGQFITAVGSKSQ